MLAATSDVLPGDVGTDHCGDSVEGGSAGSSGSQLDCGCTSSLLSRLSGGVFFKKFPVMLILVFLGSYTCKDVKFAEKGTCERGHWPSLDST